MNIRRPATRIVFVCAMLLASHRAIAQFGQQGPKLVAAAGILQGTSVSISADGNTAVVGGGPAFIWTRSGGVWSQQSAELAGSDAVRGIVDATTAVAISADGNTAIVGGPGDYGGSAWVWVRNGDAWTQQGGKLFVQDFSQVQNYSSGLGFAVSLSADGNTAIIGAPLLDGPQVDPSSGLTTGTTWVWIRSGGVWHQQPASLTGLDGVESSQGVSVSLSADGKTVIVGGYSDRNFTGAAWVFSAGVAPSPPPRRRVARH